MYERIITKNLLSWKSATTKLLNSIDISSGNIMLHWYHLKILTIRYKAYNITITQLSELWFLYRSTKREEHHKNYDFFCTRFLLSTISDSFLAKNNTKFITTIKKQRFFLALFCPLVQSEIKKPYMFCCWWFLGNMINEILQNLSIKLQNHNFGKLITTVGSNVKIYLIQNYNLTMGQVRICLK